MQHIAQYVAKCAVFEIILDVSVKAYLIIIACLITTLSYNSALADEAVCNTSKLRAETIEDIRIALDENYIHRERIGDLQTGLAAYITQGTYEKVKTPSEFAAQLSNDLIDLSQDYHFSVFYQPDIASSDDPQTSAVVDALFREDELAGLKRSNFGFQSLEILEGNIGYVRFDSFPDPAHAFEIGAAAMRFVENTDAVIFDMRYNRGGHNQFGQFITSYFYEPSDHRMIHKYAYMDEGKLISGEYWTIPLLPGKRMPDVPVFVLTSTTTFSAGEWFAFELQKLGRATLIGQTTTGASHAVSRVPINSCFWMQLPVGTGRDPIDNSDFEGVGVTPDINIDASRAKSLAHVLALKSLAEKAPARQVEVDWFLPVLEARLNPADLDSRDLERFEGTYDGRQIRLQNGQLTYHWRERFQLTLRRLNENTFLVEGGNDFRFRFIEKDGAVIALERIESEGGVISYARQ